MFHLMVYSWLVSTLHFADKSRKAAVLFSFVSLINAAETEHTQCTLSDYSRQLLLSKVSEKQEKYMYRVIALYEHKEMSPISFIRVM